MQREEAIRWFEDLWDKANRGQAIREIFEPEYAGSMKDMIQKIKQSRQQTQLNNVRIGTWFIVSSGRIPYIMLAAHHNQKLDAHYRYGATINGSFCRLQPERKVIQLTKREMLMMIEKNMHGSLKKCACGQEPMLDTVGGYRYWCEGCCRSGPRCSDIDAARIGWNR